MRILRWAVAALALSVAVGSAAADDKKVDAKAAAAKDSKKKKLLFVTHSLGFIHDALGVAEDTLTELGPKHGFEVTTYRYTGDPDAKTKVKKDGKDVEVPVLTKYTDDFRRTTGKPVEKENCGRVNKETLAQFDAVLFYTTGNPLTKDEVKDLTEWVKAGGAFLGVHCATDTLYGESAYGNLIGAYFRGHPAQQTIKLKAEDAKFPGAAGFAAKPEVHDEIYVFKDAPYSRDKVHVIFSVVSDSYKPGDNLKRADDDYAISWAKEYGKGKVFYTSLGHRKEVWKDERYQDMLFGGLAWATGGETADVPPSGAKKGEK